MMNQLIKIITLILLTNNVLAYNPETAIAACPNDSIWPSAPDLPPVPLPECGPQIPGHSGVRIANGCEIPSHVMGINFARSVVGIGYPALKENWRSTCSGTIINKRWVLTAAHCVAIYEGGQYNTDAGHFRRFLKAAPLLVIPWQPNLNKIPTQIDESTHLELGPFKVKAIYIPFNFNWYGETIPANYYLKNDYALLELEHDLPNITANGIDNWFLPLELASDQTNMYKNKKLWAASYGKDENQVTTGKLNYINEYFFNYYSPDIITITGSIPELYHKLFSAWKFTGPGDSGGPIIDYTDNKYFIVGVISAGVCDYSGFFAPEIKTLTRAVFVPHYFNVIKSITEGRAPKYITRCLSSVGACADDRMLYISNYNSNTIVMYNFDQVTHTIKRFHQPLYTGINPLKIVFDKNAGYAYVLNAGSDSISIYYILQSGELVPTSPGSIHSVTNGGIPVEIEFNNKYVYVLSKITNSVYIFKQQDKSWRLIKSAYQYLDGIGPKSIRFNNNFAYVLDTSGKILVYRVSLSDGELIFQPNLSNIGNKDIKAFKFGREHYSNLAFVLSSKTLAVYKRKENGQLNFISEVPENISGLGNIEFSHDGRFVFISDSNSNIISIYIVSYTGKLKFYIAIKTPAPPGAMSIDPSGNYLLVALPTISEIAVYYLVTQSPVFISQFPSGGYTPSMIATLPKLP